MQKMREEGVGLWRISMGAQRSEKWVGWGEYVLQVAVRFGQVCGFLLWALPLSLHPPPVTTPASLQGTELQRSYRTSHDRALWAGLAGLPPAALSADLRNSSEKKLPREPLRSLSQACSIYSLIPLSIQPFISSLISSHWSTYIWPVDIHQ